MRMRIAIGGVLALLGTVTLMLAQNGNDLFQQALIRQANGDTQTAIPVYERIVREFPANRPLAARATVQLGKASETLGQREKARDYYQQVISKYAEVSASVNEAKSLLAAMDKDQAVKEVEIPGAGDPLEYALSPDGRRVAYFLAVEGARGGRGARGRGGAGQPSQLWILDTATGSAAPVPGGNVGIVRRGQTGSTSLFWSPDGKALAFFSGPQLMRIDLEGGVPRVIASAPANLGGDWGSGGTIVFSANNAAGRSVSPLYRVPADGSGPAVPLGIEGTCPRFLPDGSHFMFYSFNETAGLGQAAQVLSIGSIDGGPTKVLSVQALAGTFAVPDQLLYATEDGLFAQRINLQTFDLIGTRTRVLESISIFPGACTMGVAVSASGALAYRPPVSVPERQFVWLDRQGQPVGNTFLPDASGPNNMRISPDGQRVLFGRNGGGAPIGSLWVIDDKPGAEARRLVAGGGVGVWSPKGDTVVLGLYRPQPPVSANLATIQLADGNVTYLRRTPDNEEPEDWSQDGRFLLYTKAPGNELMVLPLQGGEPIYVGQSPGRYGRFSPNGKWIAYQDQGNAWVQPFPGTPASRKRVSPNGGSAPKWRKTDGGELYFVSANQVMVVSVTESANGQNIEFGTPAPLLPEPLPANSEYDVSADGKRFLINRPLAARGTSPFRVLTNWTLAK